MASKTKTKSKNRNRSRSRSKNKPKPKVVVKVNESEILKCDELRGFIANESLFSHDSSLLFLFCNKEIYIHSVNTAKCICILRGHTNKIVSILMNPLNAFEIITLDISGVIKIWDYLKQECVKTIHLFKKNQTADTAKHDNNNNNCNNNNSNDKSSKKQHNTTLDAYFQRKQNKQQTIKCKSLISAKYDSNLSSGVDSDFTNNGVSYKNGLLRSLSAKSTANENESEFHFHKFVYCVVDSLHVVRINLETSKVEPLIWNIARVE